MALSTKAPIICVFSIDNAYCQHLAVAIVSMVANSPGCRFSAYIIHHDVQPANLAKLQGFLAELPAVEFRFHAFDPSLYDFSVSRHITVASYFRFFLPDIVPPEVEKVLYLDSDLVVLNSVRDLWETPLGDAALAAAIDPSAKKPGFLHLYGQGSRTMNEQLGLPPDHDYFNAGVLVVNLEAWRKKNVKDRLIRYTIENADIMLCHDQDALNGVLHNDVMDLGYEWNFQAKTSQEDANLIGLGREEFARIKSRPNIVHFAGGDKPWKFRRKVPYEREYYKYLKFTPWRDYVQPDRNMRGFVSRHLGPVRQTLRNLPRKASA